MTILLSFFYFFYFAIIGVYIIFMPKLLTTLGYSATEVGYIFSSAPLIRFVLPFLFTRGLNLDTKVFKSALLLTILSVLTFYFTIENFYYFLISNIFFGIGMSLILPFIEVIALDFIGKQKYGKVRLFGSVGFMVVALVLVKFLSSYDVALNFLSVMTFLTILFAWQISKSKHNTNEQANEVVNDINLFKDYKLWVGLGLMQVSFGAFYNFFTIYETNYGISLDMTVYLWSFGVLVEIFMLFFQGRFLKNNLLVILQLTTFSGAVRWFLIFMFPTNLPVLFFAQSLHALSFALFHTASISYLYQTYKHKSLAQQFYSGIVYGLGGLLGAIISGYMYEYFPTYLFLSSTFIALLGVVFLCSIKKDDVRPV